MTAVRVALGRRCPSTRPRPTAALPQGFRAAGVACGLKPSGGTDLGLLVSDAPETVSAARFTRSGVLAAPVVLCQERCRLDALRAVVANSGNANAATGRRGIDDAAQHAGRRGDGGRRRPAGRRGRLDRRDRRAAARPTRSSRGSSPRAASSRPTATRRSARRSAPPTCSRSARRVDVTLPSGTVRLTAQAKGAGMISPSFATMLCFVQTDAALAPETADLLLGVCVKRSFDRISVDGQLSTNDTAILMASGASGVRIAPESEDELRFGEALDAVLRRLALLIVRDGEGARRVGRVVVNGGHEPTVDAAARAVANSPLVKAALHGGDPNWGRIAQAVGGALPDTAPLPLDIWIEDVQVCAHGAAVPFDLPALEQAVARRGGRVHGRPARRGRRDRGLLLRPLARLRDDQRGVHDVMRDIAHPPRGAPVHPGVPRQDGRDQVRRRGDDRPGAARGVRPRRRAAQVRRAEPDRRPRRRAGHHRLHGAARHAGRVRRRAAGLRRADRRDREDGAGRQGQQGHRPAHQPPRAAGGRAVRRRRAAVPRRHHGRARRARTSATWGGSSASTSA